MPDLLIALTFLGDSRLLLGAAVALIAFGLACHREWARRWCFALVVVCTATLASKLAFLGWGLGIAQLDFTGVSGHAAVSAAVWPMLFAGMSSKRFGGTVGLGSLGLLLAGAIAWSRVELHAHTPSEVLIGWLLGGIASAIVIRPLTGDSTPAAATMAALLSSALVVASIPIPRTHDLVLRVAAIVSGCSTPHTRESLHQSTPPGHPLTL